MKIFEKFDEFVNEAKKESWALIDSKKSIEMYRASGKTWPTVSYSDKDSKIYARDNNGNHPSATLETSDITVGGLQRLLNSGISQPHPSDTMLQAFIDKIAELFESVNEDEDDGRPKTINNAIGPKQERCVIEGDDGVVKANEDKIMKMLKKQDSNHRMQFYPVTGKIVGALKSHSLKNVQRDLRAIDNSLVVNVKPLKK